MDIEEQNSETTTREATIAEGRRSSPVSAEGSRMEVIEKWVDRIYVETDTGRAVATSVAGLVGLAVYLYSNDWVIAGFSTLIVFPIVRLLAASLNERAGRGRSRREATRAMDQMFDALSGQEKSVILAFVGAGGCVLTWREVNLLPLAHSAIESLMVRGLLRTSVTADGMKETFVLDSALFDAGQRSRRMQV